MNRIIHDVHSGISCVYRILPEGKVLELGYSICSPHDFFSKKIGRTLAEQRLNNKEFPFHISFTIMDLVPDDLYECMTESNIFNKLSLYDFSGSYLKSVLMIAIADYIHFVRNQSQKGTFDFSLDDHSYAKNNLDADSSSIEEIETDLCEDIECNDFHKIILEDREYSVEYPISREALSNAIKYICGAKKGYRNYAKN